MLLDRSKTIITIWSWTIVLIAIPLLTIAGNPLDEISRLIKSGDSKGLSTYFGNTVDLTLLDKEDVFSSSQAELMLRDFFTKHPPKSLTPLHTGDTQGTSFRIASLSTADGMRLRVSFHVKESAAKPQLLELSIEKE